MNIPVSTELLRGVFAALSVLSLFVALGMVEPPQFAAPLTAVSGVQVDGARLSGAESVIWVFNPDMNMLHFEMTLSNISRYQVTAYVPRPLEFSEATGKYVVEPFTMRFDLSNLKTAVPMDPAPSGTRIYYYEFVDCTAEVDPDPQDVISYLLTVYNPANLISGLYGIDLKTFENSVEFRRVLDESFQNCRNFYATRFPASRVYLFLGVQKVSRPVVIPIVNVQVASYDFPKPDFFAVVESPVDTYLPRLAGQVYPVGEVKFILLGESGTYTATVNINQRELNGSVIEKSDDLPIGRVWFSFYAFSSGDLFGEKGSPQLFKWTDDYRIIYSADRYNIDRVRDSLVRYITSDLEVGELYIGRLSDISVASFKLVVSFGDALDITSRVKNRLYDLVTTYNQSVESSSQRLRDSGAQWTDYVLILPDNPTESGYMKLRFVGDLKATALGLRYIKVSPKIESVRVLAHPTGSQPLSVEATIRNLSDIRGVVALKLTCTRLGEAEQAFDLPGNATITKTITLYPPNIEELVTDTCTVTVCNVDGSVCDSRSLTAQYTPLTRCEPQSSWCSADGTAIEVCADPYKGTINTIPCGEGQKCVMEAGVAKCVEWTVEENAQEENVPAINCYCKGGGMVCFNEVTGKFEYKPCPEGSVCVTTPDGVMCKAEERPVPPPPKVIDVTFVQSDTGVRIGFLLMSAGFLLLAVIL